MRIRTVAGRAAIASLAIMAVPTAMSGVASAKPKPVSPPTTSPAWDWCSPHAVKIGHTLTIHGSDLTGATSATIGGAAAKIKKDTAKVIKISTKGATAGTVEIFFTGASVSGPCNFVA